MGAICDLWRNAVEKVGIIKEIDELGRLQIPKEIRKRLGLEKSVELVVTREGLLVKSEEYRLVRKMSFRMAQGREKK